MLFSWHFQEHIGSILAIIQCNVSNWWIIYSFWTVFNSEFTRSIVLKFLLLDKTLHSVLISDLTILSYRWRVASDQVWRSNCSNIVLFPDIGWTEWAAWRFWFLIQLFFLRCYVPHLLLASLLKFLMLPEVELGTWESLMENCHHRNKHFWWDIWVEINVMI